MRRRAVLVLYSPNVIAGLQLSQESTFDFFVYSLGVLPCRHIRDWIKEAKHQRKEHIKITGLIKEKKNER